MQKHHQPNNHSFASDNYAGVHPEILAAIEMANQGHVSAYGNDPYTKHLQQLAKYHFGEQAEIFPVFNGTATNVMALQAVLPRWGSVICAATGHINVDESTAPQAVGGFKLWPIETANGKLTLELMLQEAHGYGFEHRAQPLALSITQSTELGTVYQIDEIRVLTQEAHRLGMAVHMDGARLANAAVHLGVSLGEMTTAVGVDILSFGGTKNGLLMGECLVVLNPNRVSDGLKYLRKLNMQLASKMRFLSAQFIALLESDLWWRNAQNANQMAAYLAQEIKLLPNMSIIYPVEANAVFVKMPEFVTNQVRQHSFFYDWDNEGTVRLMCSFDTQKHHIDALVNAIKTALIQSTDS